MGRATSSTPRAWPCRSSRTADDSASSGRTGAREIDAGEFFQLPNVNLYGETVLQPNEILTHVVLPPPGQRSASYEVRFKQSHDWPLALASVNLDDGRRRRCRGARIVMGAVAPIPWRAQAAERVLVAARPSPKRSRPRLAAAAVAGAKALSGNAYKIQIAKTAVKRAILKAAGLPVVMTWIIRSHHRRS